MPRLFRFYCFDPDPWVVRTIAGVLRAYGMEAQEFEDVEPLLHALKQCDPEETGLILDPQLSTNRYEDFFQKLEGFVFKGPVVILTGRELDFTLYQGLKLRAVLHKPLEVEALVTICRTIRDLP